MNTNAPQSIIPIDPAPEPIFAQPIVVATIDALRQARPAAMALVVDYHAGSRGRGGGTFAWRPGPPVADDGGRWIAPTAGSGAWERVLNGQTANVMMFGARGDGVHDDTEAIRGAVLACELGFGGELVFPMGEYVVTDTIVIGVGVRVRGESRNQSRVLMRADKDVFRTYEADRAIRDGAANFYFDEDFSVEDLTINMPVDGRDGAAIVMKQPGEAHSIRGLHINHGGCGIRTLGVGAPGLRVHDCTIANQYRAAIQIDGFIGTDWAGYGGPVTLIGLSADHRRPDSDETASVVFVNRAYFPMAIIGMKVEGQYGGGVIRYLYSEGGGGSRLGLGAVHVSESTYNCGGPPCDFVRLQGDGSGTASVILQNVVPIGVRWLVQDDVTGIHVANDQSSYLQGRGLPVTYNSNMLQLAPVKTLPSPKARA